MSAAYFEPIENLIESGQVKFEPLPEGYKESVMQSYDEMPSRLEMAIALFTKTATSEGMGSVNALSVRIPTIEYTTIEALAEFSGLSRNKVIVQLLEVALDEVFQGMKDEDRARLFQLRSKYLMKLAGADGYPVGETSVEGEI